ncbi:hypothetical protein YPPY92_4585, partial [Yersinia pestis PY-92]
MAPDNGWE